jgi:hypothetical protein
MASILTFEDNVDAIYSEAARRITPYTPILYMPSLKKEDSIDAVGSSVLFRRENRYYLITAGHCIKQDGEMIKIGVLDKRDFRRLGGKVVIAKGEGDKTDIGIILLDEPSREACIRNYTFLDDYNIMQNQWLPDEKDYLIAGYPLSKVSIDHKRKQIKVGLMPYLSKSRPAILYESMGYPKNQNLLLTYDRRRSGFIAGGDMNMSPYPKGLSGCGVWYIPNYFVENIQNVKFNLSAILIEYHPSRRTIVATKFEVIQYLLLTI